MVQIGTAETPTAPQPQIPEVLPLLPSGGAVLFPSIMVPVVTQEQRDVQAIDEAAASPSKMIGIFTQKQREDGSYGGELEELGTLAVVSRMAKTPEGTTQAIVQGVARIRLVSLEQETPSLRGRIERITETADDSIEVEALTRNVVSLLQQMVNLTEAMPKELPAAVAGIPEAGAMADFVAANIPIKPEERMAVLEAIDVKQRLRLVTAYLNRELEVLQVSSEIQTQVRGEMDKRQREFILREQLRAIQKELGEEGTPELTTLKQRLDDAKLSAEARREADRELERLETIPAASPEYQVARTYLEWLADLPWSVGTEDNLDIDHAEQILNEDHYNLEKIKQRILDFLAVRKLRPDAKGPILCFVGPPGVGKTSLGQSIARALGRRFIRLSLGGVRDEAEIRGHRRTYVGALPGRIIQEFRRAGSNNPLFMLDEVDKLGMDYRGDPASALLEVLDPAQNNTFVDHYLDVPFDLSHVMFITTANVTDPIPGPLRDRMEMIQLSGYTEQEKLHIARRYLLPRQLEENGIPQDLLAISDELILQMMRAYTREAGVRGLERLLGAVCRYVARRLARGHDEPLTLDHEILGEILGPAPFSWERVQEADEIGEAIGMAWTPVGGDILLVEATSVPGHGRLTLTGKLGDVMQESAQAAVTYARTRVKELKIPVDFFERHDLHIHVPAGAIPKDGPSAGVTIATSLISAITERPVRKSVAMTGEITLRGKVMPVGGIRDKVLAAHRAGIKDILIPKDNEDELDEIAEDVRSELNITLTEHMDEVLDKALYPENEQPHSPDGAAK